MQWLPVLSTKWKPSLIIYHMESLYNFRLEGSFMDLYLLGKFILIAFREIHSPDNFVTLSYLHFRLVHMQK